jgi:type I restriction enzyme S subunit
MVRCRADSGTQTGADGVRMSQMKKSPPSKALKGRKTTAQGKEPRDAALGPPPPRNPSPEGATQMPVGWILTTLGEFGDLHCGQSLPPTKVNRHGSGVPYVTGPEHWDGQKVHLDKWTDEPARMAPEGCIFITVKGAGVGKLFPGVPCAIGRDIYAYRASSEIPRKFVELSLRFTIAQVVAEAKGDIPGLSKIHILDHTIPLPPLAEQKRIVSKIEELFSELDAGEESLRRARRQLGVYRQSLLKQAFEGKLTAPWRKQNPHLLESSDQILNRIEEERQARYEQQLKEWKSNVHDGKRPTPPVKGGVFVDEASDEDSKLPKLPKEWTWVSLNSACCKITDGEHFRPTTTDQGIYFLSAKDVRDEGVSFASPLYVSEETAAKALARCNPEFGDILIVSRGATVGRMCVVKTKETFCLLGSVILLKPTACFDSLFLNYAIKAPRINRVLIGISGSTAQQAIYLRDIKDVAIPSTSLPEQREIVRLLDEQFTVIEQNEREIDAALKRSAALRQSILKKAFTGQLVPQDPTDEPASALLERIRKERSIGQSL